MKATTQPAKFQPIVLTLETEEEAKAIFAVLNHIPLRRILGIDRLPAPSSMGFPEDLHNEALHGKITKALK